MVDLNTLCINVMPDNQCFYDVHVIADVLRALLLAHRERWGIVSLKVTRSTIELIVVSRTDDSVVTPAATREISAAFKLVALTESERSYRARYPKQSDPGIGVVPDEIRKTAALRPTVRSAEPCFDAATCTHGTCSCSCDGCRDEYGDPR